MSDSIDVLVLRRSIHRLPITDYAQKLQNKLPDHQIERADTPQEEQEKIQSASVVTGFDIPDVEWTNIKDLKLFACTFAGTDHLPINEFKKHGIAVTSASGVHGPNIAEHVIGSILVFSRRFHTAWKQKQNNEWRHYRGGEFQNSTVTIVGLGAIGSSVARRLEPFGVKKIAIRHSPEKDGPVDEVHGYGTEGMEKSLSRTDYLVLACPLTNRTRNLVDQQRLITLPKHAVLINVARGAVVDTDALVSALGRGEIRGAALDVTKPEPLPNDHPLWDFSNVLITPHNAGSTPKYFDRLSDIVVENVKKIEETGSLNNLRSQVV